MKEIPLTKGRSAIVDDNTFSEIGHLNWCINSNGYAMRMPPRNKGVRTPIYMHKEIMGAWGKTQVDHINGNKLDNRLANLRICNTSENHGNMRMRSDNTSGFKGVIKGRGQDRWYAHIHKMGVRIYLGSFTSKREAAMAYDSGAERVFGEFAMTNKAMGLL